ncbi:5'-3' exoribonuclease 3 [Vitis vinifera]|uniref:5'-3' exoribonuclease 3 n=1 Tax=Vitis vinifera TaxID=29760 RepID=A0A438J322_VITVI|nr:5'-3' exoribonuclease 3 [Vitis vinifera]
MSIITLNNTGCSIARQAERIKREKAQARRGDDADPQVKPEFLVPVSRATVGAAIVEAENDLETELHDNKDELKAKLKELLREKSDLFNSKIQRKTRFES